MTSGGAERVASTLSNAWTARGDKVILMPTFSGRGECFYQLSPKVRLVFLADLVSIRKRTAWSMLVRLFALRRFINKEKPDVIISFLPNVNLAAIVASIGLGVPVIVSERNDRFASPLSGLWKFLCRITYPFASGFVVQTQALAQKYVSSGQRFRLIRVIPNPLPERMSCFQMRAACKKKRVLGVGRLVNQKQFDLLIEMFKNLPSIHSSWSLRIVGEGPLRGVLQQQINDSGLVDRIELSGLSLNITEELANSDIFVSSSKHEGFPNALLEAMAVGLPCVTFDCPVGPREISLNGDIAVLVPLNDQRTFEFELNRLMLDADLRSTLGNSARISVIERFSLDKVLKEWDSLFDEVGVRA